MSYKELEKKLYSALKSKEDLNELCEKLLVRYDKLNGKYLKMVSRSWDRWSFRSLDIKDRTEKTAVLCGL